MNLENKVVVVTGASQGLGKALSQKLAKLGAKLAIVARGEERLKKLKEELGGNVDYFVCDVSRLEEIQKTVTKIQERFGNIDILVNNAGIWTDDEIERNHPERRKEALDTNALGHIHMTEAVLPLMREKNSGCIFNVISTAGTLLSPANDNRFWKTYGATKWALNGYTKALRDSLQETKIKVTGFFPGGFDSNLYENAKRPNAHNQPWMMKTEDVADIIIFCLTRPDDVAIESLVVTKKM